MSRNWTKHITPAQVETVSRLRREAQSINPRKQHSGSHEGWWVYMEPSTPPAQYLEARHKLLDHRVARYVVDADGSIAAHNYQGASNTMLTTDGLPYEKPRVIRAH